MTKRRTKTMAGNCSPKWAQTFTYPDIRRSDIQSKSLEVTVYDYDRIGSGEYIGEVKIVIIITFYLQI